VDEQLAIFENITRRAPGFSEARSEPAGGSHPFDDRNIHNKIQTETKQLFDDGHYAQATFEAFKLIDKTVAALAKSNESGTKLMMQAFNEQAPLIQLTALKTTSEKDEQQGYKFIFAGSTSAIRNPRGHEVRVKESAQECLDHLSLASLLMRRLENIFKQA
jgi:uncharacterized protein (TIGR02391 family)